MDKLYILNDNVTRTISPENPTGTKGASAMAEPLVGAPGERLGKGWKSRPFITIPAHTTDVLCDIEGSGEIVSMWITGEVDRSLILRAYYEGAETPAVECPLTEFFCYGWAEPHTIADGKWNAGPDYKINSALMSVNPNRGFASFISMPFRKKVKFTLENRSANNKAIYYQINYELKELPENIGYFHAHFNVSMPVKYKETHCVLHDIKGKGLYLGTSLYVGLNRASRWWGEGEFKFYLDGDKEYPTICTTGLEDYFLGAFNWDCMGEYREYSHLYSGMNVKKPDGLYEIQQRFTMYRWHVVDPIRFEENLFVDVQCLGWTKDDNGNTKHFLPREDDYLSVAYFYLDKPYTKLPKLPSNEMLSERF